MEKDEKSFKDIHTHLGLSDEWQIDWCPERISATPLPAATPRYARITTDQDILKARKQSIPEKTQQDTTWCVRQWNDWVEHRNEENGSRTIPTPITSIPKEELAYWLERFVLEIRKKDGKEYIPSTLHHIVCGIMRFLRLESDPSIDFFNDAVFANFRHTLDGEMKRIRAGGLGTVKRKAECITPEEETPWSKGILGDHSPRALLNTVFYMTGLYFALRSGKEHRQLRHNPCQIEVVEKPGEIPYLLYTEDVSKNNQGGLKGRKTPQKVVKHYANTDDPSRCFVRIFKLYNKLCPSNRPNALYLKPLQVKKEDCWYANQAIGHNTLSSMMQDMCKKAGIEGYKTNHSLRATAASRLFHEGVDEQLIMERTGHHSLDGVRSYKRTATEQVMEISDILNRPKKIRDATNIHSAALTMKKSDLSKIEFNNCSHMNINIS